jgi:hypothetical protein
MSDKYSTEFKLSSGGHPHDLLARLYREIGISAVAAALEVSDYSDAAAEEAKGAEEGRFTGALLGDDIAA